MPRLSKTYPFARNRCDNCGQAFPTQNGVRCHIGHSPLCQAAALQNSINQHSTSTRRAEDIDSEVLATNDGESRQPEGVQDLDINPDIFSGLEGGFTDQQDHTHTETHPRYARKYDEGHAANVLGSAKTAFESMKDLQEASGHGAYAPFKDRSEWELAKWLVQNVNQRATDEFLKLSIVSHVHLNGTQPLQLFRRHASVLNRPTRASTSS